MSKKIFELAKEIGIGPLDLVEKLKGEGFAVRNHMTSLSDEDLERAMAIFSATPAVADTKTTKKKVVKKKVAKKKTTTKKVEKEAAPATSEEDGPSKKVTLRKKKSVIRKKASSVDESDLPAAAGEDETTTAPVESSSSTLSEALGVSETAETETAKASTGSLDSDRPTGLRVVATPEPEEKAPEEAPVEKSTTEKSETPDQEIYREKVHRFTPVFIPESKPAAKTTESKAPVDRNTPAPSAASTDSAPQGSKKRLGGLASMMSGKKSNINKSQALTQDRADSELKSYAALSGTGRPIYTTIKRKRMYSGPTQSTEITELKDSKRVARIHNVVTAVDLAKKLKVKLKELVDKCLDINLLIKGDDYIGMALASEIAALYGYRVENIAFDEEAVIGSQDVTEDKKSAFPVRDPIITIMGHVDHGKTTLLDHIRKAKVAAGEAGGITQHIGAYSVSVGEKNLTFLDTPGHAAFASMRQRGADVTDIVVLVVAADDGVMPQTRESVKFCQNSNKPIIIAVNKCDKEGVNTDRIKNELSEFGITPEEWGGETMFCHISALTGDGVDNLLESIALTAEMMEMRANPKGKAEGVVIESKIEGGRGPVATILVQSGTLKKGDSVVVGETYGRARSLTDHLGRQLPSAGPSIPVQILGLDQAPSPGDSLNVVKNEREAKKIVQNRINERKMLEATPTKKTISLEDFFAQATGENAEKKSLNLIIRSDVQGSFEAIKQALVALSSNEVEVKVIGGGVGAINDNDVQLAESSEGILIGFNMRPLTTARRLAEEKGIEVRTYSVIYDLINEVKLAIEGMLEPEFIEKYIGRAEVKDTFVVPKVGVIAGSVVIDGNIQVGCQVRLLRNGKIVFDGKMSSLKRFKDDVKEVKNGYECGVGLEGHNDVKVGDLFEAYLMEEKKRTYDDVVKAEEIAAKEKAREEAAAAAAEDSSSEQPSL